MITKRDIDDILETEVDPYGKGLKEKGSKVDKGKAPVWQGLFDYFPRACIELAKVSEAGANKYSWKGWEHVPDGVTRYRNAGTRHIVNEAIEGTYDPEGFRHLAQITWNFMAALELTLKDEQNGKT